jgi:hypothetical protein
MRAAAQSWWTVLSLVVKAGVEQNESPVLVMLVVVVRHWWRWWRRNVRERETRDGVVRRVRLCGARDRAGVDGVGVCVSCVSSSSSLSSSSSSSHCLPCVVSRVASDRYKKLLPCHGHDGS